MITRLPGFSLLLCFLLGATWSRAENNAAKATAFPTPVPLASYSDMIRKSPFAPATPAATPVVNAAGFAASFYVSGVAKIGEKDFVTITSKDGQTHFSLMPGEVGPDGITITRVDWSAEIGKSKVTMKKGNETGVAEFDQAALQRPAGPAPQPPPGQLPQAGRGWNGFRGPDQTNVAPPAGARFAPQAPIAGRPQIPGVTVAGQTGTADPQNQPAQQRRIRIINSRPQ